jgi:putative ABC transport system permease protein
VARTSQIVVATLTTDEGAREHATMFAYGVPADRVVRLGMVDVPLAGALGAAAGIAAGNAAGNALLAWIVNTNMPETMPDVGMLASVAPVTYALAIAAGTLVVAAAPALTLRRLKRTDVPSTLRVVE